MNLILIAAIYYYPCFTEGKQDQRLKLIAPGYTAGEWWHQMMCGSLNTGHLTAMMRPTQYIW